MPRPKRKSGAADFSARSHTLSSEAREETIVALGLVSSDVDETDPITDIFHDIEKWLGFYKEAVAVSARLPGPADYERELRAFEQDIQSFLKKMRGYPAWVRKEIALRNGDLGALENGLVEVADICASGVSAYEKQEGRGRKKDEPRLKIIQKLRRVFDEYYVEGDHKLSASKAKLERKDAEYDFVKIALRDAGIPVPKDLARLIKAPESALPQERAEMRKRVSKKAEKEAEKARRSRDKL